MYSTYFLTDSLFEDIFVGWFTVHLKHNRLPNTSRMMREICINKETSGIRIAQNLVLDKSTISSIVTKLIKAGKPA